MAMKALAIGIFAVFSFGQSTCEKSSAEDATKDKGAADARGDKGQEVALEGVDTSQLTPREKKEFSSYVSEFLSPCQSVPVPIAQCIQEKRACDKCGAAAKFILRSVKDGMPRDQVETAYKGRFDASGVKNVPIDGSPVMGPESAAVTIVEFADFECPHCGQVAPALDKIAQDHKADVRLSYKFYPLPGHPHADIAARAGIAAMAQGKFWEMHHAMFQNQQHLEQPDLDSYAKELGLDISRFHADMQSNQTTDRITKDKKLGEDLKIAGTPSIFINGRSYDGHQELPEWVAMEIAGAKGTAAPAPSASASPPVSAPSAAKAPMPKASGAPK